MRLSVVGVVYERLKTYRGRSHVEWFEYALFNQGSIVQVCDLLEDRVNQAEDTVLIAVTFARAANIGQVGHPLPYAIHALAVFK